MAKEKRYKIEKDKFVTIKKGRHELVTCFPGGDEREEIAYDIRAKGLYNLLVGLCDKCGAKLKVEEKYYSEHEPPHYGVDVEIKYPDGSIEIDSFWDVEYMDGPRRWEDELHETLVLKCGLEIALDDYWEIDDNGEKKIEFSQQGAIDIEEKTNGKWRIPTMAEWAQIVEELGTKDGEIDRDTFVKALNLTEDEDGYGYYWSSTVQSSSLGYFLAFYSGGLTPAYQNNRFVGWSVRCVRGEGEK